MSRPSLRAIVAASSCLALGLGAAWAPIANADGESSFKRLSTTAAYLNSADSSQESVAEISTVSLTPSTSTATSPSSPWRMSATKKR